MTTANKINTSETLLALIRQEYAHGRVFTFRGLQIELGIRNGIQPTGQWLNDKLCALASCGESAELSDGTIIPTGVPGAVEARKPQSDYRRFEVLVRDPKTNIQSYVPFEDLIWDYFLRLKLDTGVIGAMPVTQFEALHERFYPRATGERHE